MTAAVSATTEQYDVRTIVGGGMQLGIVTTIGVAVFALLSRALSGTSETLVQSGLVLLGGIVFSYFPSVRVRPRSADAIAWASLLGLLGALTFTVLDTAILRPLDLYHWTWDEIGGGSGFWYIPVWWMGSAFLAWLGGMVSARTGNPGGAAPVTAGLAVLLFVIMTVVGIAPFHAAVAALAFTLGLILHVPLAAVLARR